MKTILGFLTICTLLIGCAHKPKVMRNCSDVPMREGVFVCDELE